LIFMRERGEMNTGFSWGDVIERDHLEDLGLCGMIILKLILKKSGMGRHELHCSGLG